MPTVLVTGMSGTGKSTALELLAEHGYEVVDTDTNAWSEWVTLPDGSLDWIWREDAMARLLDVRRKMCSWPGSRPAAPTRTESRRLSVTWSCDT